METKAEIIARYKELASCLDRLKNNPDWIKLVDNFIFGDFTTNNVDSIIEPTMPDQQNPVRVAIRNVQNVNWLKGLFKDIVDLSNTKIDDTDDKE